MRPCRVSNTGKGGRKMEKKAVSMTLLLYHINTFATSVLEVKNAFTE